MYIYMYICLRIIMQLQGKKEGVRIGFSDATNILTNGNYFKSKVKDV